MSALTGNLADGAIDSILTTMGESITYTPSGGSARTITALVRRSAPEPVPGPGSGRLTGTVLTITVKNHTTDGIGNAEINAGGDKVTVAVRQGDTARALNILTVIKQTGAYQTFECRGAGKAV